ncbi:MAG: fucose isomerase [Verrucomicrobiales bacterium]
MKTVYLVANGDLRTSANQKCEAAQAAMEKLITQALQQEGYEVKRAHGFDNAKGHGFIDSQKMGMEVFRAIPKDAPLIVAEAVWQYSHHLLQGLFFHQGPILTLANWSGQWPGLVGMLNLNGSLLKAGVKFSSLWSDDFSDDFFKKGLKSWLDSGQIVHDTSHAIAYERANLTAEDQQLGKEFAQEFREQKAIMGVFDEGCMGMYNAIIPDELLHPTGVFKERLSQSSLYASMQNVTDAEAEEVHQWFQTKGMTFHYGTNEEEELTKAQVLQQCKMYIAALRIADTFGCDCIGIQYQQGLKDLAPASDLVEGTLNNVDRPPVRSEDGSKELFAGEALPHFNEVDECAGLDGLVTYQLWKKLGYDPENTLHDLRWGRHYTGPSGQSELDAYVWVFLISGAAPPAHFIGGWAGADGFRQPPMYFRLGGSTLRGISKPGWIVWSRVYIMDQKLCFDTGLGEVVELPKAETEDRWENSTPQWPIMHVVLQGVSRDQMMARHASNHIQVVYAPDRAAARRGMIAKASAMKELGLEVSFCGDIS